MIAARSSSVLRVSIACSMLLAATGQSVIAATDSSILGRHVPGFLLTDPAGKPVSLADFGDKRFLCLVFVGTACPVGNRYLPILNDLGRRQGEELQIVAVNSNPRDTLEEIAAHAEEYQVTFPVLQDTQGRLTEYLDVVRTNEVFLLDAERRVRYHGRIDDRYGVDYKRDEPRRHDLVEALNELRDHRDVSVPETEVAGCRITRSPRPAQGQVTYAGEVSRIIQSKCQNCHRPNTAAPFSLLSYDDAANWAEMIKEVVLERRMPPWHADPRHGAWQNDRRLSQTEIDQLVAWVDDGAPVGDEAELPPEKHYSDGWTIGEPDLVFEMPEEVTVPATGVVPYQYFETETHFKEDVWIQAAEARPGNRAVVHHIIVFYRPPGLKSEKMGEGSGRNWICGTAPGDMPLALPPGVALKIPAGSTLLWQMHYTPTGKEEKDRSQIGLVLYKGDQAPKNKVRKFPIANTKFEIPPGARHHQVVSEQKLDRDVRLLSFMPHMHVRGKSFKYEVVYPDGRTEVLLSVPRYDFNWQSSYRLAEPLRLPAGTTLRCTAHYDNSADNPANPDPTEAVRWGDQTFEEMMIGYVDFILAEPDVRPGEWKPQAASKVRTAPATAQADSGGAAGS